MKKTFFALFLLFSLSVYAYEPSSLVEQKATSISAKINAYLGRLSEKRFAEMIKAFATQLPAIQSRLASANDTDRMYLLEFIRRHLPGAKMIDTAHVIDDDDRGFTWTHAPDGFEVFYFPDPVPTLSSVDSEKNFSTLINGSYFARMEGGTYPAGLLYAHGQVYTEFVSDDRQLSHMLCRKKNGAFTVLTNDQYVSEEDIMQKCDIAFQAGPLIYDLHDGIATENLAPKTYIGGSHTRTVMVIFTSESGTQDLWFLTVYTKMTLAQVRDVVLSETRFIGTYKNISVLNLDGGSSVAYKSKQFPELNFGTSKKLPIVFGIK